MEIYLDSFNNEGKIRILIERLRELRRLKGKVNLESATPDINNIGRYMTLFRQVAFLMRELAES